MRIQKRSKEADPSHLVRCMPAVMGVRDDDGKTKERQGTSKNARLKSEAAAAKAKPWAYLLELGR
jgi:hypothetical protein